jgi:hypothetical protein
LVFLAGMLFATFGQGNAECEVCVDFNGRSDCRTVTAPDRDQAIQQATATACTTISSGVTESMKCNRTPPRVARCSG